MSIVNSGTIDGFTRGLLAARYDNPKPIPSFHREMWDLCCSDDPKVAIAAPRSHAKSTAITHAFLLAMVLFRVKEFVLLVSDTEGQAIEFLSDIKDELQDNEALRSTFGIKKLLKGTETNVICQMKDGHLFRIQAKGSEQKVRGLKWRGKRPDLIVCHEEGTEVFADGEWMKVEDHPTAKRWKSEGFEIFIEGDNAPEKVSKNHMYWVKTDKDAEPKWVEAKDLQRGMFIGDPI